RMSRIGPYVPGAFVSSRSGGGPAQTSVTIKVAHTWCSKASANSGLLTRSPYHRDSPVHYTFRCTPDLASRDYGERLMDAPPADDDGEEFWRDYLTRRDSLESRVRRIFRRLPGAPGASQLPDPPARAALPVVRRAVRGRGRARHAGAGQTARRQEPARLPVTLLGHRPETRPRRDPRQAH